MPIEALKQRLRRASRIRDALVQIQPMPIEALKPKNVFTAVYAASVQIQPMPIEALKLDYENADIVNSKRSNPTHAD